MDMIDIEDNKELSIENYDEDFFIVDVDSTNVEVMTKNVVKKGLEFFIIKSV